MTAVALSPDGQFALTGSSDDTARLWSTKTGREIFRLEALGLEVPVAFVGDGSSFLTGAGFDRRLQLWSVETGLEIKRIRTCWMNSLAVSEDGKVVLVGCLDKTARLLSLEADREVQKFEGHMDSVNSAALSPNGAWVLTGGSDVRLWSVETGKEIRRIGKHEAGVNSVAFSPDGEQALTGSDDGFVRLCSVSSGEELYRWTVGRAVRSVAFAPAGRSFLSGSDDGKVRLHVQGTDDQIQAMAGHRARVTSVAFSRDGRFALSGSNDQTARIWSLETFETVQVLGDRANAGDWVGFCSGGDVVVSGATGSDGAWVWPLKGKPQGPRATHANSWGGTPGAVDARCKLQVGRTTNGSVSLQSLETGREIRPLSGKTGRVSVLALSRDGKIALAAFGDGTIVSWSTETGTEIRRWKGPEEQVESIAISDDNKLALTGYFFSSKAILWSLDLGTELHPAEVGATVYSVAFSADERWFLAGSTKGVQVLSSKSGEEIRSFRNCFAKSAVFSRDGKFVLGGCRDGTLRLWSMGTGSELSRFEGHFGQVSSVAISEDGALALSGGSDATTRIWKVQTGEELARMISYPDGGWLVISGDERYFDGSEDGLRRLYWVQGLKTFDWREFSERRRPDLLSRLIAGEDLEAGASKDHLAAAAPTRGIAVTPLNSEDLAQAEFDPAQSVGLFVGVRSFRDESFAKVPYAVDDAVDLADLFVFGLKLIPPERVVLALSGDDEPVKDQSKARLKQLMEKGARRFPATQSDILDLAQRQRLKAGKKGMFLFSVATHGVDINGSYFLTASDTLPGPFEKNGRGGLSVEELVAEVSRSEAPRRIVFLDACRRRLKEDRSGSSELRTALGSDFEKAVAESAGLGVLAGSQIGGYAYDDDSRQNGVFSAAIIDGLSSDAAPNESGLVTLGTLAEFVDQAVREWVLERRPSDAGISRGVSFAGDLQARAIPLAKREARDSNLKR